MAVEELDDLDHELPVRGVKIFSLTGANQPLHQPLRQPLQLRILYTDIQHLLEYFAICFKKLFCPWDRVSA